MTFFSGLKKGPKNGPATQLSWRDLGNPLPSGVRKEATYHELHDAFLCVLGDVVHLLLQMDRCSFHVCIGAEKIRRSLITRRCAQEEGFDDLEKARADLCRSWSTEQRKHVCRGPFPSWPAPWLGLPPTQRARPVSKR